MIDREGRLRLAELLRRLLTSQIIPNEFDAALPRASKDRGVSEVSGAASYAFTYAWEYRLDRDDKVTADFRRHVGRWILFLDSELEYEWPAQSLAARIVNTVMRTVMFRLLPDPRRDRVREILTYAGPGVWPFSRQADYDHAAEVAGRPRE